MVAGNRRSTSFLPLVVAVLRDDAGDMENLITLVAALLVVAPFVVLALRTTRWDPVGHRRHATLGRADDAGGLGKPDGDDLRRVSTDLVAAAAHAAR
jgi:hypothetical protein